MLREPFKIRAFKVSTAENNMLIESQAINPFRHREAAVVEASSRYPLKMLLEDIAYFFQKEMNYEFVQYKASDVDPYKGYLFSLDGYWVGGACFRWRGNRHSLQWVWIHPFARHRGILKDVWMKWENSYQKFPVEGPVSPSMKAFLLRQGVNMRRVVVQGKAA